MLKKSFLLFPFVILVPSLQAYAGSVSGLQAQLQTGSSSSINCDQRVQAINCTDAEREFILDKCYVVLHKNKIPSPTWNSLDFISIVGSRPSYDPVTSSISEFGISAPIDKNVHLNCTSDDPKSCLPKHPFDRHYLTVREAFKIRMEYPRIIPPFKDEFERVVIFPLQSDILDFLLHANPYTACAKPSEKVYLIYVGARQQWQCNINNKGVEKCSTVDKLPSSPPVSGYANGVRVGADSAEKVCRNRRRAESVVVAGGVVAALPAAACYISKDAKGSGAREILRFKKGQL
jgi:hypothetical protein